MRDLFHQFRFSECGASLVEYAVALIVVTIVGGSSSVLIGNDAGDLARCAASSVSQSAEGIKTGAGSGASC